MLHLQVSPGTGCALSPGCTWEQVHIPGASGKDSLQGDEGTPLASVFLLLLLLLSGKV